MITKRSLTETEKKTQVKIDPELLKQINTVAADNEPVEAVFMLRPDDPMQIAAPPELCRYLAKRPVSRRW